MAPALTDGVPGLEGIHTLIPPSPWPTCALNDWMDPATGLTYTFAAKVSYTRLQLIGGLFDKANADDPRVNLVNQIGELAFPRQQRGKTLVYTGVATGKTLSAMRAKVAALRAATETASSNPDGWTISLAYDPTYDPTGMVFTGYGVPIDFTSDDVLLSPDALPSPHQRPFVLSFRLADPRFWLTSGSPISTGPVARGTSAALTMTGTAPSEPTFTLTGTGSGSATIVLNHSDLARNLQVDLPAAMASGDTLVVNFLQRTVVFTPVATGVPHDYSGYIDWSQTDWWGEAAAAQSLVVGVNNLYVTGDGWQCDALPAVW
jgi:hypothetical protein